VVVGDIEVARARVVREHTGADVLEPATFHREAFRTGQKLHSGENRVVRIAERQSLEVRVVRRTDVEEREVTGAVEDRRTVAGRCDGYRLIGPRLGEEVIRPVERRRAIYRRILRVFVAVVFVDAGVHEDG